MAHIIEPVVHFGLLTYFLYKKGTMSPFVTV